jgi:hypothetical protein
MEDANAIIRSFFTLPHKVRNKTTAVDGLIVSATTAGCADPTLETGAGKLFPGQQQTAD